MRGVFGMHFGIPRNTHSVPTLVIRKENCERKRAERKQSGSYVVCLVAVFV